MKRITLPEGVVLEDSIGRVVLEVTQGPLAGQRLDLGEVLLKEFAGERVLISGLCAEAGTVCAVV